MDSAKARTRESRRHRRWLAAGLLLSSLVTGAPALAQGKGAPADAASGFYEEGVKAAQAGEWETARAALVKAFALKPDARRAANLGLVELAAGKPRDAAEHLSFFLREAPDVSARDRQTTEDLLAKAKSKIGTVTVSVNVDQAEVLVDGRTVGASPLAGPVFIEPGSRKIEVRRAGFAPASQGVEVAAGSAPVVELKLTPALQSALVPARTPGPALELPRATDPPRWRTWGLVGGLGLAAAGAAVGTGFTLAANAENSAAEQERKRLADGTLPGHKICPDQGDSPGCGPLSDLLQARDTHRSVATAAFAMGGVGAAGALFSVLWRPNWQARTTGKGAGFSIAPSPGGFVVSGTF